MKKWMILPILVFLLIFFSCKKQEDSAEIPAVGEKLASGIDSALNDFEAGNFGEGAGRLLDGILLVRPREDWPAGFAEAVEDAKARIQKGDFAGGGERITAALAMIRPHESSSHADTPPEAAVADEQAIPPLAEIFAEQVLKAKEEFRQGNAEEGVVLILKALQLLWPRS